jgi:1-deoxy-D-xylulose-5-phosphate reductoisomerase
VLAQLGSPDMRTPIAHALAWPSRMSTPAARLDLAKIGSLTFEAPDPRRFPALALARRALDAGGAAPIVLNAANEVAVHAFLEGAIGFLDIVELVERTMLAVDDCTVGSLETVFALDAEARAKARELMRPRRRATA